ncbi:MAG: hypothetical protein ACI4UJ_01970 [Candidatus Cryptobacteroides sp.]
MISANISDRTSVETLRKLNIREHLPDLIQDIFHQEGELIVPVIVGNGAWNMNLLFK